MTFKEAKTHLMMRFQPQTEADAEALIKVSEACDKQIRRKPVRGTQNDGYFFCAVCGKKIGWKSTKFAETRIDEYCAACGQHIETAKEGE